MERVCKVEDSMDEVKSKTESVDEVESKMKEVAMKKSVVRVEESGNEVESKTKNVTMKKSVMARRNAKNESDGVVAVLRVSGDSMTAPVKLCPGPNIPSGPIQHLPPSDLPPGLEPNEVGPCPKENPGPPFAVGHVILCNIPGRLSGLDPSVSFLQRGFVMEAEDPSYKIRLENGATFWTDTRESWLKARWAQGQGTEFAEDKDDPFEDLCSQAPSPSTDLDSRMDWQGEVGATLNGGLVQRRSWDQGRIRR
jgi:hypothetical protein